MTDNNGRAALFSDYARRYAELGWALIRLDGKRPKDRGWEKTRPDAPDLAAGKWAHWGERWNMGVVLGASRPPLAVIEPDPPKARERLLAMLGGQWPPVPIVETGNRSLHLYYLDGGQGPAVRDGLELRCGNQVCVLPPSTHPATGRVYGWLPGHELW
jgi:hypothetical protein